jgi:hypothetical protein
MNFTQAQARQAVGLSVETFRHWRKVMRYLHARQGREPQLSFGDLVALSTLRSLVDDLGLNIGQFALSGDSFFEACNHLTWIEATGAYALIVPNEQTLSSGRRRDLALVSVSIERDIPNAAVTRASIVIPLDPVARTLRASLLSAAKDGVEKQPWLPLPLRSVR